MKKGEMLSKAILIATNAHHGQFDRGGNPYILHPLKILHYLKTDDEELQYIGILHDTVEDTNVTYKELIEAGMSERVISGVKAITKVPGQTYEEYKESVFSNVDAMKVKLCDLRHNTDIRRLKGITDKDKLRMIKYHEFAFEIQQKMSVLNS